MPNFLWVILVVLLALSLIVAGIVRFISRLRDMEILIDVDMRDNDMTK